MADKLQGKPADRAAEKSIIDPSVSASHSTRHLRNPPTTRPIFGAFRHVRVIRRRARHICIEDSFRQSKVGKGERESWNGSRATGKTMPSVLHDVPRRAIVSLPEKRELDACGVVEDRWKIALCSPILEFFFGIPPPPTKDSRRKCGNKIWIEMTNSRNRWMIKR